MSVNNLDPKQVFSSRRINEADDYPQADGSKEKKINELAQQVAGQLAADSIAPYLITGLLRIVEFSGLMVVAYIMYQYYVLTDSPSSLYIYCGLIGGLFSVGFTQALGGYNIISLRSFIAQSSKVITGFLLAMLVLLTIGFIVKITNEFSRVWFVGWFAFGIVYLVVLRAVVTRYVKKLTLEGRLERRAVIVGGGKPAAELIRSLEMRDATDIRICGIFDDRSNERSPSVVAGYPKLGTVAQLVEFTRVAKVNMLIVTLPLSAENRVLQLLKKLWVLPVDIRLAAHANKLRFRPRSYSYEGSVPFLDLFEKPIADWDAVMKRTFDLVFSIIGIVLFSPVMLATMIAIRLESKGPVIFRQKRFGFNNEAVDVFKFRSMFHEMTDPDAKVVVTKNDPRVTRVGRFIRKTSLDELPQLFNVLRGNLSLVGPRPHAMNAHTKNQLWDEVVDGYFARHKVKPGVTGWAQVNGWRGEVDNDEKIRQRVNHDLYYIENWSLLLDLYIVFITPIKLLKMENAY
ncbi:MAG: undecaprenyl-phosphate glucose phosphotransferase [Hyphomicrobiales bacterium]|nr:undecaprenyl-phosphate glucose phosphotransferase [Hyphomicrobiales bacterium]